jgi:hypothetical protein
MCSFKYQVLITYSFLASNYTITLKIFINTIHRKKNQTNQNTYTMDKHDRHPFNKNNKKVFLHFLKFSEFLIEQTLHSILKRKIYLKLFLKILALIINIFTFIKQWN